jgi:predicted amidohydrolase YtcJ
MTRRALGTMTATALILLSACSGGEDPDAADAIFTNGRIYTVNEAQPWVEAVAVKDGRILAAGSTSEIEALSAASTSVMDLEGRFVMPGVFDLHSHPFITPWYGSMNLSLENPGDPEAVLAEIAAYAEANPDREWIIGGQYLAGTFPDDNPRKEWLDEIVPDRPVAIMDQTGHALWLNSRALELAGITAETETSNLIVVAKDPTTGEPTGLVNEQAMQLVERVITQADPEEYVGPVSEIFEMFLSYGITAQQPAEGHRISLEALKLMEEAGTLDQRVFVSWDWKTTLNLAFTVEEIEDQIRNRAIFESESIRPNYVKIFADGSPASFSSILLEPYSNRPGFTGEANLSTEAFADAFAMFDQWGVGVHVHAMGDGSIRRVVDALEIMKERNGDSGVRHKVAHNTMITDSDIQRIAAMTDVNMDFSPPLWYPHAGGQATFEPALGEERYSRIYPVRTAVETPGLHVGQGADWLTANPTPDPFIAIEGFVTRESPFDPDMPGALGPDQAITLEQAIAICTIEGAWVLGVEEEFGSIEVGKFADMIVLDQNLFEIDPRDIYGTQVLHTIVGGNVVYDRAAQGNEDVDTDDMVDRMHH